MAILAGKRCQAVPEDFVMREADRKECEITGFPAQAVLLASIEGSEQCFEIRASNGDLLGVWGVRGTMGWFLTSQLADKHPIALGIHSREVFVYLLASRPFVDCWVHAEHALARKWLTWSGFRETIAVEINGATFLKMRIERKGDPDGVLG